VVQITRVFKTKSEAKFWLYTVNRKDLESAIGRKPVRSIGSALNRAISRKTIKVNPSARRKYTKVQIEEAKRRGIF
jgi:hypothetical protein